MAALMEHGLYSCEAWKISLEVTSAIFRDSLTSSQVVFDSSRVLISSTLSSKEPSAVESM